MRKNTVGSTAGTLLLAALVGTAGFASSVHAGVIAHWSLDEGAAGTVASGADSILDGSGNDHHGTPFGNPIYTALPGGDTGLDFSNDHIRVTSTSQFESPSMTVEALVNIHSLPSGGGLSQIVFRGDVTAGEDPFYLGLLDNNLRWYIEDDPSGADALHYDVSGLLNQMLHVAGTIDDATGDMRLFVNGAEVASKNTSVRPTHPITTFADCGVSIGALHDCVSTQQFFDGVISEVRISDVALSPNQFLGASATAVPAPASAALMALGVALMGWWARRRVPAAA